MAILARDGMGGWTGLTPERYAALTDRFIVGCLFARRDRKGRVVPERRAARRRERPAERADGTEGPAPTAESLGVPEECFRYSDHAGRCVPVCWAMAFWQAWRARGLGPEETLARWRRRMAQDGRRLTDPEPDGNGQAPA
jgi:hypothetical protein